MKSDLTSRVERTHKHIHGREERVSADFSEQSVEMDNQVLVMSLDAEGREELKQIEAALARLAAGAYGDCTRCGKAIVGQRLDAIPFASLCIDCAKL
jgi:DnaK suppressor protein